MMEESKPKQPKHTPGPWEENSALAAAAPELLECLKEAVLEYGCGNCIEQGDREVDCPYFEGESWRCSYGSECLGQQWLAAIRKAEGLEHD